MFGNIKQAVGGFFSNLFGGNNDEEKRRREREAAERRRQQAATNARNVQKAQQNFQSPGLNQFNQASQGMLPPQMKQQQAVYDQMRNRNVQQPFAKKEAEPQMTEAQKKALEATKKAAEQVKQVKRSNVKDINKYRETDLRKLQIEIEKGENADTKRIEGLLRSVKNRQDELQRYKSKSTPAQSPNRVAESVNEKLGFRSFLNDEKKGREANRDNEIRQSLAKIDKEQLGGSISSLTRKYNTSGALEQSRIKKELEKRASMSLDYGDERIRREREEAKLALLALDVNGKKQFNPINSGIDFAGGMLSGMKDYGANLLDSASVLVNDGETFSDAVTGLLRNTNMIDDKEVIRRKNAEYNRLNRFTGGKEDRGLLDRVIRSAAAGAEGGSYFIPGAAGVQGFKQAGQQGLRQALSRDAMIELAKRTAPYVPANMGAAGAAAFREGTDTRLEDVAAEAALGGLFAAGSTGVGSVTRGAINSTKARMPSVGEAYRGMTPEQLREALLNRGKTSPKETLSPETIAENDAWAKRMREEQDARTDAWMKEVGAKETPSSSAPVVRQEPEPTPPVRVDDEMPPQRSSFNAEEAKRRIDSEDNALLNENPNLVRARDGSIVDRETGEIVRESPAVRLEQMAEALRTETAQNIQMLEEAAERQAAPEAGQAPAANPELEANNAYGEAGTAPKGNAVPDNYLAELERRRAAFAANEDKALVEAQSGQRQREEGYDPTGQIDRQEIGRRLAELGVDPRGFEGVTISRLNQILDGAERADNPGGYIRSALRSMEANNRPNPTMAAINPLPSRQPRLNERGEVMTDADGMVLYEDSPAPQTAPVRETPTEYVDTPEGRVNTATGEIVDEPPVVEAPVVPDTPSSPTGGYGRGSDGTYSSAFIETIDPALPIEQRIASTKELSDTIVTDLDGQLNAAGSSPEQFFRKLEMARDGNNTLTPDESRINQWYQAELENIARYTENVHGIELGRRGDGYYSPEYMGDFSSTSASQLSDMFDGGEMAGSTYQNKGKAREQGLDYSVAPTEKYIQEMLLYGGGQSRAGQANKLVDNFTKEAVQEGRVVDASFVNEAASKMITLMDEMSYAAAAGRGKKAKATKEHLEGKSLERKLEKVPVVQRMNEIGKLLNKTSVGVTQTGNAKDNFTLRGKVNNMLVDDSTLGDQGINIFYEARGYADRIAREAFEAMDLASSHLEPVLDKLKYLSESDKSILFDNLNRKLRGFEEQVSQLPSEQQGQALVQLNANALTDTIRKASRMNLIELAQRVDIQKPADLKTFQDAANRIMVNERIQQGYVDQLIDGTSQWINAALRGYNPKSAATELGDLGEIASVVGKDFLKESLRSWNPSQAIETMNRWGRMGSLDPRGDFMQKNVDLLGRIHQIASADNKLAAAARIFKTGIDPMLLVKGVTLYKESLALNALENYWTRQGLSGSQLVDRVYRDYYETVLPASPLNKSILSDTSMRRLLFQYQNWQAMNVIRTYNFMSGQSSAGRLSEMGRASRVGTYAGTAGATKLGLWAVQNTLFGSSLAMSFGLFDPFGMTQGDFTGIDREDKNLLDKVIENASFSPLLSLGASGYFAHRQEEERVGKVANEEYVTGDTSPEYNVGNALGNFFNRGKNMIAPGANQFFKSKGFLDAAEEGYSLNKDGRVQYQTPEAGTLDWFRGLFGGKGATAAAREYGDSADVLRDPFGSIKKDATVDNLMQLLRGEGTRNYNRPLATSSYDEGYNEQAIAATQAAEESFGKNSPEARKVMADWVENGRKYNRVLDDFKKNNPEMHKRWIETMGDDVISPEKWQIYRGNPDIFAFMKERKALEARDLGRAVDPIYNLPPEQAALVLQERSSHTGEDMKLRTLMYQYPWYNDFKAAESAYYDTMTGSAEREGGTDRAKSWYKLSTYLGSPDGMKSQYPLVQQQEQITQQYGFGSAESKAWFKANADAYLAEKEVYDQERFGVVNQMRALEGVEPMTWEQFKAKIEFPEEDSSGGSKGYSKSSRGGRGGRGGRGSRGSNTPDAAYDRNTIAYVDTRMGGTEAPRAKRLDTPENLRFNTSPGGRTGGRKRVRVGGASRGDSGSSI